MIIWLMLAYAIFMQEKPAKDDTSSSMGSNLFSNLALWAARVQLVILYATAGFYKLQGNLWVKGEALYYVLSTDFYSHPLAKSLMMQSDMLLYAGNYFALGYQLLFPILIWFTKLRMPLLLVGTFFHLSIILVNGVADFGLAMIVCYFIFLPKTITTRVLKESLWEFLVSLKRLN